MNGCEVLEVDTTVDTTVAMIGTEIDLSDAATADPAATAVKTLFVRDTDGIGADKKLIVTVK